MFVRLSFIFYFFILIFFLEEGHCIISPSNKNVDIKFSAHDTFLEQPLSGALKIERLDSQIIYHYGFWLPPWFLQTFI